MENIESGIFLQPIVRSFSDFRFKQKDRMLFMGTSEESSEEISSVALLSPACFILFSQFYFRVHRYPS